MSKGEETNMLRWEVVLLVLGMVAAVCACYLAFEYDPRLKLWNLGLAISVVLILGMRWVRSRLLALLMLLSIFVGLYASLYPIMKDRSWSVWLSVGAIIFILGTILTLKLWNPLTNLPSSTTGTGTATTGTTATGTTSTENPANLKVISWNVFMRTFVSQRMGDNDFKEERVKLVMDAISDADVVCLQEACSTANFRVHRMLKLAARHGFKYFISPSRPPIFSRSMVDSGLLFLSKVPIVAHDSQGLPTGIGDDAVMHKALQHARLRVGTRDIDVYNTHVQSDYSMHSTAYERFKRDQYKFIGSRIRSRNKKAGVILCGDLNCNRMLEPDSCERMVKVLGFDPKDNPSTNRTMPTNEALYSTETGAEIQTVFYKEQKGQKGQHAKLSKVPRSVDYILQRGLKVDRSSAFTVKAPSRLPVNLSDHKPVAAWIRV
jgi:endonuclease/exonuclease/phosphatase family metal-dependent hydrolase